MDISNRALSDNRLDVLDVAPPASNPDYKNLQYNEDGSLSFEPEGNEGGTASFNDQIKILGNIVAAGSGGVAGAGGRRYENTRVPPNMSVVPDHLSEDYMNDYPEGLEHTYSNQDDLLMQVIAGM